MNTLIPILLILVVGLVFGGLAWRASRARRGWVKWVGLIGAGLLSVLCLLSSLLALIGWFRWQQPAAGPAPEIQVEASAEQIARGERLAYLCANCHSSTEGSLPLDGGTENIVEGIATVYAPNLTPAGEIAGWSDGEVIRAIRQGVHPDGRALLIMPSQYFRSLGDEDAAALVAYLRSQPPIEHDTPPTSVSLPGLMLIGADVFPTEAQAEVPASVQAPPAEPTAGYGAYVATLGYCETCHGPALSGGDPEGFVPVGPPLPALVGSWSADEFVQTMRTGVDPSGHELNPERMPWAQFSAAFTDDELRALYEYIASLEAQPAGSGR